MPIQSHKDSFLQEVSKKNPHSNQMKRSAFLTNALSRFEIDGVLGPPGLAQRTLQDPCICVVPWRVSCQFKKPFKVKDRDKVAAGWNGKEYSFLDKGSLKCPLGYQWFFQWLLATSLILLLLFVWGVVEPWCTRTDFVFRISNIGNTPPIPLSQRLYCNKARLPYHRDLFRKNPSTSKEKHHQADGSELFVRSR